MAISAFVNIFTNYSIVKLLYAVISPYSIVEEAY